MATAATGLRAEFLHTPMQRADLFDLQPKLPPASSMTRPDLAGGACPRPPDRTASAEGVRDSRVSRGSGKSCRSGGGTTSTAADCRRWTISCLSCCLSAAKRRGFGGVESGRSAARALYGVPARRGRSGGTRPVRVRRGGRHLAALALYLSAPAEKRGERWKRASIVAEPRSAYLLAGPSRTVSKHSIPARRIAAVLDHVPELQKPRKVQFEAPVLSPGAM